MSLQEPSPNSHNQHQQLSAEHRRPSVSGRAVEVQSSSGDDSKSDDSSHRTDGTPPAHEAGRYEGHDNNQPDTFDMESDAHFLFAGTTNWGHLRPMLAFSLNLATIFPRLYITFFAPATSKSQGVIDNEIHMFSPTNDVSRRFRVIPLGEEPAGSIAPSNTTSISSTGEFPSQKVGDVQIEAVTKRRAAWAGHIERFLAALPGALKALNTGNTSSSPKRPSRDGMNVDSTKRSNRNDAGRDNKNAVNGGFSTPPTLFILDLLIAKFAETATGSASASDAFPTIPIIAFTANSAAWNIRRLQPGGGKRYAALRADPVNISRSDEELLEQAYTYTDGSIVEVPGNQPAYDYELQPQIGAVPFEPKMTQIVQEATRSLFHPNVLGLVLTTSPEMEPGIDKELARLINGVCLQVGPQFPARWWNEKRDWTCVSPSKNDQNVLSFLGDVHNRFGSQSLLYISFGSEYSPSKRPDLLEILVETLLTTNDPPLPFLFATATTGGLLSPELHERVKKSGVGMFVMFAPQQLVLQHPVTGWFLTHGGSNSVSEAILNKVPMILWPCMTDQPVSASQVSLSHRIGIELIQVRTGPSVGKPTYRGVHHAGGAREAVEEELRTVFTRMRDSGSRPRAIALATPGNTTIPTSTHARTNLDGPSIVSCGCGHDSDERYSIEKQQQRDEESGAAIRLRMEAMQKRFFDSWKSGEARKVMLAFAQWF